MSYEIDKPPQAVYSAWQFNSVVHYRMGQILELPDWVTVIVVQKLTLKKLSFLDSGLSCSNLRKI